MMVEGEMKEVSEQDLIGALKAACDAIKPMCRDSDELSKELGTDVKREYCHEVNDDELRADCVRNSMTSVTTNKPAITRSSREDAFDKIKLTS
jgi:polyribonucleotide nucleotidyltransferase